MRRLLIWLLVAIASMGITILAFYPASGCSWALGWATQGRLTLLNAEGTVWRGSANLAAAEGKAKTARQLLPGRFTWRLSPLALLGRVDLQLSNPTVLSQTILLVGNWKAWQMNAGAITLPIDMLTALGAPFNSLGLSGQMKLSWQTLNPSCNAMRCGLQGIMILEMNNIRSALQAHQPLGSYRMLFDWRDQSAQLALETVSGPLLLSGTGRVSKGDLQFSGIAEAQEGQKEALANLLNLLGQRRVEGGREVIGIDFK